MVNLITLIDKAAKVCGSQRALAVKMGLSEGTLSSMKKGRTITPETAIELAHIAGESVHSAVFLAVMLKTKGTRREEVLKPILEKALAVSWQDCFVFSKNQTLPE